MKKKRNLLSLLACLSATTAFGQTPTILFQDDFETPEPDGTPSIAIWGEHPDHPTVPTVNEDQWVRVTSENSEAYFGEANNGYLHLYSNGASTTSSNWISTQNNQFAGSNVISVHFDFQRTSSAGNLDPKLRFGQGNPIFSTARYTVYFNDNAISAEPVVENDKTYHFQAVYNNTAEPVTYLDGQAVLKPDSYDIWIDGVRVMAGVKYAFNGTRVQLDAPLTSIAIGIWGTAQAEMRVDNLVVYDGAYAVGEAPPPDPVIEDQVIFADDFSQTEPQAEPNESLSQPLASTWNRTPTSVAPPGNIIEVTAENSELYFGETGNNYLRFFKDAEATGNLHLTAQNAFEPRSELVTISFDFYETEGTNSGPFEIIPGINTSASTSRTHRVQMDNGSINGKPDVYQLGVKNNVQLIFNHSYADVSYIDGQAAVDSDRFDVWVNGRLVLSNAENRVGTSSLPLGTPLSAVQFIIWSGQSNEVFIDNLEVFNYAYVKNPDLTVRPVFADDFSSPVDGKPDAEIWNDTVANELAPNRVIEVTDANSEIHFGEASNNYMRIFHDGTTDGNLNIIAENAFESEIITVHFDFMEPSGFGVENLVLRPGTGTASNDFRIHEITFSNGNLSGEDAAYLEGVKNNIQIVMNNSAESVTYLDGTASVASDTYDVWLNGELLLDDHQYNRGFYPVGEPLRSLQFVIWRTGSNEFLIDNLEIYDRAHVIPAPSEGVTFDEWAEANLPEGLRGPQDDAAGDGISNLVKFALGIEDPLTPNRDVLPTAEPFSENGETRLSITTQLDLAAIDVNVAFEVSTDLVNWTSLDVEPIVLETISENKVMVRVTDTETIEATSRRFLRLNVSQD